MLHTLLQSPLFKGFSEKELENLLHECTYAVRKFPPENVVAMAGEECRAFILILKGSVRGEMTDDAGKLIKIEEIKAPNPIAHAFLFAKHNIFPVTVTTTEKSEFMFIEKNALLELLQKNKQLLTNFLSMMSDRSKFLSENIGFLAFKTIKNKLAGFILRRAQEQKQMPIILTETQQELADYFGVTRPSLARSLSLLEEEGIICITKKSVTILDLEMLKNLAK